VRRLGAAEKEVLAGWRRDLARHGRRHGGDGDAAPAPATWCRKRRRRSSRGHGAAAPATANGNARRGGDGPGARSGAPAGGGAARQVGGDGAKAAGPRSARGAAVSPAGARTATTGPGDAGAAAPTAAAEADTRAAATAATATPPKAGKKRRRRRPRTKYPHGGGASVVRKFLTTAAMLAAVGAAAAESGAGLLNPSAPAWFPRPTAAAVTGEGAASWARVYATPEYNVDKEVPAEILVPTAWNENTGEFTWRPAGEIRREQIAAAKAERVRRFASPRLPPNLKVHDPPNVEYLRRELAGCPLKDVQQLVADLSVPGFTGLPLRYEGAPFAAEPPNRTTAYEHADVVHEELGREWSKKVHLGPFTRAELIEFLGTSRFVVHPVFTVERNGKQRLVHHFSWDDNGACPSVNGGTPATTIKYQCARHLIESARQFTRAGGGLELAKGDKAAAYLQWPVRVEDYPYTVFRWLDVREPLPADPARAEHFYYIHACLSFGATSSVQHYHAISRANAWLAMRPDTPGLKTHLPPGVWRPSTYVDDQAIAAATGWAGPARRRVLELGAITRQPENVKKLILEGAVESKKTYIGVCVDGARRTAYVDEAKVARVKELLRPLLRRVESGAVTLPKKGLASAGGILTFVGQCSWKAARHLASVWRALKWARNFVPLSPALRDDLRWWSELWASGFNGTTFWPDREWAEAERGSWWTDACMPSEFGSGDLGDWLMGGAGAVFENEYWLFPWPEDLLDHGLFVNQLEALTTLAAMETWGPRLRHRRLFMHGDNEVACGVQNKGAAKEESLDAIARGMDHAAIRHGFEARASHVPSAAMLADPLSRGAEDEFLRRYALSGLAPRFGPARRVEPPAEFLREWLVRLGRIKREAAAGAVERAPAVREQYERRMAKAKRRRERRARREKLREQRAAAAVAAPAGV
jgi:hypothetical protein